MKQSQRMINALARSQRPFALLNKMGKSDTRVICFHALESEYGRTSSFFGRYCYSDASWRTENLDHILEFDVTECQLYPHIRTANTRVRASMVMAWP